MPRDQFTEFVARIEPSREIRTARLYFRSELYPEYYFVDMSAAETGYTAVIPLPTAQTHRVVYYIEVVDQTFQVTRSEEHVVSVAQDRCDPGPGALLLAGNPGIVVGAVSSTATGIPAGFQATGIIGFASTGAASGGGLSVGLAVGAAAGAAAGAGVLVASHESGNGSSTSTSTAVSGPATTPTGGSTTSTSSPTGPPTTTTIPSGNSTSSRSTSTVPPSLSACFDWEPQGNCRGEFISCSEPHELIETHDWRMLGPPVPAPLPLPRDNVRRFPFDFAGDPRCLGQADFNRPVRLIVTDSLGRSAQIQKGIAIQPASTLRTSTRHIVIRSKLAVEPPDGRVRAQVLVDGIVLPGMTNQGPLELRSDVASGEAVIEGILQTPVVPGTLWEFDLSANPGSSFGDILVVSGTPFVVGRARIVFRLEGREGEHVRFRARSK